MALSQARIRLLCRVAEQKQADAQRALAGAQRQMASQQRTEEELRGFLAEYETRVQTASSASLLENQQKFLTRLRDAMDSQQQQARMAARQLDEARTKWIGQHQALAVVEALRGQVEAVVRLQAECRSQKDMDECAASRHSSNPVRP